MKESNSLVKKITIVIIAAAVVYAFSGALISTLLNHIIDEFHLTGTSEGIMSSLMNVGLMVTFLVSPALQGRIKKLKMIMVSTIILTVALLICGFAGTAIIFGIGSIVLGIGSGFLDGYMNSTLIDLYPEDSTKPMGLLHGFYGIGSLVMPLILQALLLWFVWRGAYYVVAILFVIVTVLIIVLNGKIEKAGGLKETEEQKLKFVDIKNYFSKKNNIVMFLYAILAAMAQAGIVSWIVRFVTLKYNAEATGALCVTIFWLAATVNRFLMPKIKMDMLKMIIFGCLFMGIAMAIGIFVPNIIVMCVMVGFCGLFSGHLMPGIMMIAAEGYQGNTTLTTSMMSFAFGIGRVAIPLIIAAVKNSVSLELGMLMAAIAAVLGTCCGLIVLKDRKNKSID